MGKLIDFYYRLISTQLGINAIRLFTQFVEKIPIVMYEENQTQINITVLVNQILSLKKENPQADTSNLEEDIDELVYKLYELTPEEIEVVKNS